MKQDKNSLIVTLFWVGAYVVSFSAADKLSLSLGTAKMITAPFALLFVAAMVVFLIKRRQLVNYGLCRFQGNWSRFLYFLPLLPIVGLYLMGEIRWEDTALSCALHVVTMICVGFAEELLFRGFLYQLLREDNKKVAVFVASITFGLGHIVNLLNGRDFLPTLLQMLYATGLGFMLTMMMEKGKSLFPCILLHCILNVLSLFRTSGSQTASIVTSVALFVMATSYGVWLLVKATPKGGVSIDEA